MKNWNFPEISYDPQADAWFIEIQDWEYEISEELRWDIILDFDKHWTLLRIEILNMSHNKDFLLYLIYKTPLFSSWDSSLQSTFLKDMQKDLLQLNSLQTS